MNNPAKLLDVTIVGGGPAGISSAIWCAELGLSSILLEGSDKLAGQLFKINAPIINYPGTVAENGREMAQRFVESLGRFETAIRSEDRVVKIDAVTMSVMTEMGSQYSSRIIVIATGVRRRNLGVIGEIDFAGRGIIESGVGSKNSLNGKRVLIVGGGDAAFENAVILSEVAKEVTLVHRRDSFAARDEFIEKAMTSSNVKIIVPAEVISINGSEAVESVTLRESRSNIESTIPVDAVLIRIGVVPNTEMIDKNIETDPDGYIIVDRSCLTNHAGIFAVGDVSNKTAPTIAGAVGDGATAIKTAYSLLTAS